MELRKVQAGVSTAVCEAPGMVSAAAFVLQDSLQLLESRVRAAVATAAVPYIALPLHQT